MPLVTLQEVLKKTIIEKYAVGAFNIVNHTMVEGILSAAEDKGVPIILNVAEAHLGIMDLDNFIPYLLDRIRRSSVPIVLNFDHGTNYKTIIEAIDRGFSSVMFDGSTLPFEENVFQTKKIVRIAHSAEVSVEAELGHVGGLEDCSNYGQDRDNVFTEPEEAVAFVRQTGIDALAVSIGTVHGVYRGVPCLNYKLLKKIRQMLDIPLVLHGGSGLSIDDYQKLVTAGINKINFFTGMSLAAVESVSNELKRNVNAGFPEINLVAQKRIKEIVLEHLKIFGTKPI